MSDYDPNSLLGPGVRNQKRMDVPANAASAKVRMDRADELLAQMINDIGTGPAFDRLRKDALRIKHVLRGLDW